MKAEYINPFLSSLLNVLETMANYHCKPGKLAIKTNNEVLGDITGIMGMVSEEIHGTFLISFPEAVAIDIYQCMLDEPVSEINYQVADMVGELVNMITGGAKKIFSERGFNFEMALPTVVKGKQHAVRHQRDIPTLILPFETKSGKFYIEVCFHEGKNNFLGKRQPSLES